MVHSMIDANSDSLWIRCPVCRGKTRIKVYRNTVILKLPLFCPRCKQETIIDIVKLKMVVSKEPDA